jgi:hypothetical protein
MDTTDKDREFRKIMKEIRLEKPGSGFSSKVMEAIYAEEARRFAYKTEPVLGRNFWIFVGLFAVLAGLLILASGTGVSGDSEIASGLIEKFPAPEFSAIKGGFARFWESMSGLPATLGSIMIAASLLILADKFFSAKHAV